METNIPNIVFHDVFNSYLLHAVNDLYDFFQSSSEDIYLRKIYKIAHEYTVSINVTIAGESKQF